MRHSIVIAAVFAAAVTISGSAQDVVPDSGRWLLLFQNPIVQSPTLLAPSGTTKRSATLPANHANSCVCSASNPG